MPTHPLWLVAGWTMLHFLWVGSAIALATLLVRFVLRSAPPTVRYTLTLIGFAALAVAPIGIAGYLWQQPPSLPVRLTAPTAVPQLPSGQEVYRDEPTIDLAETPITFDSPVVQRQWTLEPAVGTAEPTTLHGAPPKEQLIAIFDRAAAWLPLVWLIGTPLTFLLLATGLIGVERLRKDCRPVTSGPLFEALTAAAERLSISGRAALALSERVAQPMLIGVLRPVVLLPASAASGYSPEQLEMVLLHELAHVRRRDNLVNLGQRVIESLLFFHPAVWLVSRQLRADREQCCDALVVRLTDDPQSYAELLVAVAEHNTPLPLAASAMASHPLARRVRRILQLEDEPMLVSKKFLLAVLAVGLGLTGACGYSFSQGPEAVAEPVAESAEEPEATPDPMPAAEPQDVEAETPDQAPGPPSNPHFLSLEDQRIADLAFRMLDIEVAPLDDDQAAAVKEKGFASGLVVTKGTYGRQTSGGPMPQLLIQHGDILVGLHVWPVESFDGLAEVLRRNDLDEFNPLKFYVLRWTPKVETSPRAGTVGYGGGYGGRGGEYGEIGGGRSKPPAQPEMTYKLVTGRINFDYQAWNTEQQRITGSGSTTFQQAAALIKEREVERNRAEPVGVGAASDATVTGEVLPGEAEPKTPPLAKLTYNGRSFEEWNTQWRTELSEEQRIEAVQALAAFGRAGYWDDAGEAILRVAAEHDFVGVLSEVEKEIGYAFACSMESYDNSAAFRFLARKALDDPAGLDRLAGVVIGFSKIRDSNTEERALALELFDVGTPYLRSHIVGTLLRDARNGWLNADWGFLIRSLQDEASEVRSSALKQLRSYPPNDLKSGLAKEYGLAAILARLAFDSDEYVRRCVRMLYAERDPEGRDQLAAECARVLDDPGGEPAQPCDLLPASTEQEVRAARLAAVRCLAAVGFAAGPMADKLAPLAESGDPELAWAAAVAIDLLDNGGADSSTRDAYLLVLKRHATEFMPGVDLRSYTSLRNSEGEMAKRLNQAAVEEVRTAGTRSRKTTVHPAYRALMEAAQSPKPSNRIEAGFDQYQQLVPQ